MSGKQKGLIVFVLIIILAAIVFVNQRMSAPDGFLSEEEVLSALSLTGPEKEIQDILQIDEQTYFVPFIANENTYGSSVFKWIGGEWEKSGEAESTGPLLVKGDARPYIVWHVDPEDDVTEWALYFIRTRNYSVSHLDNGNEQSFYSPHIQLSELIETGENNYGYAPVPVVMQKLSDVMQNTPEASEYMSLIMKLPLQWQALNGQGEVTDLEKTRGNGGGGSYNGEYVFILPGLYEEELE
ncbi:hypothetical protein KP77_09980 [Jeotgalibacillus alimentarius]|uniref:Uncharacterized protein n=1 Tax=Jeotgalibacillus alimentarius TaxID=135826 RepID=A0A0C2W4F6_9BACL|nr:hypothetical protein [Jeotgalibacillus alimentarius]KIL51486.1 hypothetical protein KP77_09980 [Jeotgalibacillus alimentarius]